MKINESKLREMVREALTELFGFGAKKKGNVDCEKLAKRYQQILFSSMGPGARQEMFQIKRDLEQYCPEMAKKLEEKRDNEEK